MRGAPPLKPHRAHARVTRVHRARDARAHARAPERIMRTRDAHTSRAHATDGRIMPARIMRAPARDARGPAYVRGIPLEGNPDFP